MVIIVCALHCEAKPLITHFGLRGEKMRAPFDLYRGDEHFLLVTGVGRLKAAISVSSFLSKFEEISALVNIGICGGNKEDPLGELYLINKVTDVALAKSFYPQMLMRSELAEATISTFDRPVAFQNTPANSFWLADMEASGIWQAANAFIESEKIQFLKIVSDHLCHERPSKEYVSGLVAKKLGAIEVFISNFQQFSRALAKKGANKREVAVTKLIQSLRLTEAQSHKLDKSAIGYKLRSGQDLSVLDGFIARSVTTTHQRNIVFREVVDVLSK